jgi:hypothetical protein
VAPISAFLRILERSSTDSGVSSVGAASVAAEGILRGRDPAPALSPAAAA